jgi:type I restriction enzyme, S subunit
MTRLPNGWQQVTLNDAAEVVMGQSPPSSAYNETGEGVPFFQGKAEFGARYPTVKKWTIAGSKRASRGDILMSVRAPVGPTNVANVECVIGRGLAAIRAKPLASQTFLLWVLRSLESEIASKGVGTTFTAISGGELRSTRLPLPPLAEQERIVEVLEEQFSRLDSALASIRAVREKAAVFRRSLLHAAFAGELTGGTKGWRTVSLGELCRIYQPKTIATKDLVEDGEYVVFGANGIIGRYDKFNHEDSEVTVTCRGATCGTVNVTTPKAWITGNAMVCSPKDGSISKSLLALLLKSVDFTSVITGTAQPQITRTTLSPVGLLVPPREIQRHLVSLLEEQLSRLENALDIAGQLEKRVADQRRSLLHSAFKGQFTAKWRESHV